MKLFLFLIALISTPVWADAVFGGAVKGSPWYIMLLLLAVPLLLAITFTIGCNVLVKRVNRAEGNEPLKIGTLVYWWLGIGAFLGTLMQWGMQELVLFLTGFPVMWKLIVVAFFTTGIASMVCYELLRWWYIERKPGFYAMITVKHKRDIDYTDQYIDSDLTRRMSQDEIDGVQKTKPSK